jgi:hypothetical protein
MNNPADRKDTEGKESKEIKSEPKEIIEVDQEGDDEEVDQEQLEEYREKVLELGRFAVSVSNQRKYGMVSNSLFSITTG